MFNKIEFGELSALVLDFVDEKEGFLYLRMVGEEPIIGAIWAKLSARDRRGRKWGSPVQIKAASQTYPQYVATQTGVQYKTLRTRLPSGLVDLAMIHPRLTVAEDNGNGFYFLTYDQNIPPPVFFERLNATLSIPLKPEWASWLWSEGQQPLTRPVLEVRTVWQGGQQVEEEHLTHATHRLIVPLDSLGTVGCFVVHTSPAYRDTWLSLIRNQLRLGIRLREASTPTRLRLYVSECWRISETQNGNWRLLRGQTQVLEAPSLPWLLAQAQRDYGLELIVPSHS